MLTGAKRHFVQFFSYNRDFKVFRGDRSRSATIKDLLERVIAYARDVAPSFQRGMCKLFRHAHFEQMTHGIYLDSRIPGSANPPPTLLCFYIVACSIVARPNMKKNAAREEGVHV